MQRTEPGTSLSMADLEAFPALSQANLRAAMFERSECPDDELAEQVSRFITLVDTIEPWALLDAVNVERSRHGFPPHTDIAQVEALLSQRKQHYLQILRTAFSRLDVSSLVTAITQLADSMTVGGTTPAPELVYDLTDTYAVVFHRSLEEEAGNIRRTLPVIREHLATGNEDVVGALIQVLGDLLRYWRYFARPIQLSAKARGLTHIPSADLCAEVRLLAVDSQRHFGLPHVTQQINTVLEEVFADVPEALAGIRR